MRKPAIRFRQRYLLRVQRGQGRAVGAAEDHMTCMLDAWKCMGLFTVLCDMWYFVDVHVGCLEVQGTTHMMDAKSSAWSYLKRGWDNDLTFERASRSLAKTGLIGPPWRVKNHSVF